MDSFESNKGIKHTIPHVLQKLCKKYPVLENDFKKYNYFSDDDLKEIKSWFENVKVFTQNTNPNALKEEKNRINSEILALNKETQKKYKLRKRKPARTLDPEVYKLIEEHGS